MSWTTTIDEIVKSEVGLIVRVTITDGTRKVRPDEYHVLSEVDLKQRINADIAKLSNADTQFPKLVTGPYDPTIASTIPTAKQAWASNFRTLQSMKHAITEGLKKDTDQDVVDLKAKVLSDFLPDYLDLL